MEHMQGGSCQQGLVSVEKYSVIMCGGAWWSCSHTATNTCLYISHFEISAVFRFPQ